MGFFDTTPLGRIMNIFSADVRAVDIMIGMSVGMFFSSFGQICGNIGILGYTTKGTMLVALVPLGITYSYFQRYYQTSNLELKRLDSLALSPIVSSFTETLYGITSIRAFGAHDRYSAAMDKFTLQESTVFCLLTMVDCWKQLRLDVIGSLMSFFVYALAASTDNFIPPSMLLVAITYSNTLPGLCSMFVTVVSNVESAFNSVDRIMHYIQDLSFEEQVVASKDPSSNPAAVVSVPDAWPREGIVTVKDIDVGYRQGPAVLRGLSFETRSNEKVGVVGRTGSGKSTLIQSLFRFENPRKGSISIDGVDLSQVPLKVLRSRIGIIPQDSVLWAQSLRFNLDPFCLYSDATIWGVLEDVCIKEQIQALPGQLSFSVAENGSNLSAGQRQLVCFARCLLKKPKVLLLDEATASVDKETDLQIQTMVRRAFVDCTVLTIAHRLDTVMDSDRILVLDGGELAEYDTPEALLAKPDGQFKSLHSKFVDAHQG